MTIWEMILTDKTVGVVTWIGTIGGGIGLVITFKQVTQARNAAQAASDAVQSLKSRLNIGSLSYSYAQIDLVRGLVHSDELRSAQMVFDPVKRAVLEVCSSDGETSTPTDGSEVTRRNIRLIETHLNRGIHDKNTIDKVKVISALGGIATFIIDKQSRLTFQSKGD